MEHEMRKLISGMKISADEKFNPDDGDADWGAGVFGRLRHDVG
jgi:hypothetical protein